MINITNTYQEVNAHHETDTMANVQPLGLNMHQKIKGGGTCQNSKIFFCINVIFDICNSP